LTTTKLRSVISIRGSVIEFDNVPVLVINGGCTIFLLDDDSFVLPVAIDCYGMTTIRKRGHGEEPFALFDLSGGKIKIFRCVKRSGVDQRHKGKSEEGKKLHVADCKIFPEIREFFRMIKG
jgi:hypothetical protein